MHEGISYVGLDTSKTTIHAAVWIDGQQGYVDEVLPNEGSAVGRFVRKVQRKAPGKVVFCYEAGPCGYGLQRQIRELGSECEVAAPSLIPVKPGERIKTNRRDARKLAEALRAGILTMVRPPTPAEEAVRGLCRAREATVSDRHRSRQRAMKFLLQRGHTWNRGRAWTLSYRRWLHGLVWDHPADQAVFSSLLLAIEQSEERLKELELRILEHSHEAPYRERVGWLRCFRGIDTITAMTLVTELHGIDRFSSARALMAYLGMVPSEHSTGTSVRRGRLTCTGNRHARRVLIEAAWNSQRPPVVRSGLLKRRQGQPAWVLALADRAQQRLYRRYRRLTHRGLPPSKVNAALARELTGFVWAALTGPTQTAT